MTEKMAKIDEQIAKVNEKIEKLTKQKKELLSKQSEEKRKKRVSRLIERGAILEKAIGNAENMSNEQLQAFLIDVFSSDRLDEQCEMSGGRNHIQRDNLYKGEFLMMKKAICTLTTLYLNTGICIYAPTSTYRQKKK